MASCSFHRSLEALTLFLPYRLSRSSVLYFVLAFYPPNTLATLKSLRLLPRERVSSIHRASEKANSRKLGFRLTQFLGNSEASVHPWVVALPILLGAFESFLTVGQYEPDVFSS